jgi:tetratricopeptide (TPR) repeat protein
MKVKETEEKRMARKSQKLLQKDCYHHVVMGESLLLFPDLSFDSLVLPGSSGFEQVQRVSAAERDPRTYFESALKAEQDDSVHKQAHQHALIYLSWIDLCEGKFTVSMDRLQLVDLSLLQSDELPSNDAMIVCYYTVKQLNLHYSSRPLDSFSSLQIPRSEGDLYWFWLEWLVYVYLAILVKEKKWDQIQYIGSTFLEVFPTEMFGGSGAQASNSHSLKKIGILRAYLKSLMLKMQNKSDSKRDMGTRDLTLSNPLSGFASFDIHERIPSPTEAIVKQVKVWLGIYERLVVSVCSFPSPVSISSESQSIERERYQRVLECYDWWVMVEMCGRFLDDAIGDVIDRCYHLLETLYRATTHTFHSLSILRYISHTFLILTQVAGDNMCLDEKREALNAVESYLFHWEKEFTLLLDAKVKEKRDLEMERMKSQASIRSNGKVRETTTSPTRFLSHRLSGQISQLAPSFGPTLPDIAGSAEGVDPEGEKVHPFLVTPSGVHFDDELGNGNENVERKSSVMDLRLKDVVVVPEVQGETVPDVIGVLITGIRLILLTHEGNIEVLKEAATMGEKALIILNEHGNSLVNFRALQCKVNQWLGVVYGELGLETTQREDRLDYQTKGTELLQKAVGLEDSGVLRYQYALSLVELGDFELGMSQIQKAIEIDPAQPSFYNLLALMLDSREQTTKAIEICKSGWRCCIEFVLQSQVLCSE